MKNQPKISIILCVRNTEKFMRLCIDSILNQTYPSIEIVCIEGGSTDKTVNILQEYKKKYNDKFILVTRYDKQPEGKGNKKWLGFKKAKGEIVGIVDSDNILQKKTVLSEVASLFQKEKNLVGVLGGLSHDKKDTPILRFISLFGGDPFFAYRSIDFLRNISSDKIKETKEYQKLSLDLDNLSLTGGNVFFYKKKDIQGIGGYDQDVLVVSRLVAKGKKELFIIKDATKHYAAQSLFNLGKKMMMQKDRSYYEKSEGERFRYFPKTKNERNAFFKNIIFNFLLFPNLIYSWKIYEKTGDVVAFTFPLLAFSTSLSHALNILRKKAF